MHYIAAASPEPGIASLTKRLIELLKADQQVLWLPSGGSNIQAATQIMAAVPEELSTNLSIMLIDERYGPAGHADSNWQQLMAAGFEGQQAKLLPVLQDGLSLTATAEHYEEQAKQAFDQADSVVGLLGIGPDGHTAGILPGSAAVSAQSLVCGYESEPYERLTLTFPALRKIDVAYVFAFGEAKKPTLGKLQQEQLSLSDQPAQILKELPEVYLYSDQLGEEET